MQAMLLRGGCSGATATRPCSGTDPTLLPHRALFSGRPLHPSALSRQLHSPEHLQLQQPASSGSKRPQRLRGCTVQVAASSSGKSPRPKLEELQLYPLVNLQGFVQPEVPAGTQAAVFAVYEQGRSLQYIGFSKDLRNSLRTLFGRRPDKAHFYRAVCLQQLDQAEMIEIRQAWYDQAGGPPPGNKLPVERDAWQKPVQSAAISERGRAQAADEMVKQLLTKMRQRGCKEEFVPNPELLAVGEVDFLPAAALSEEELAQQRADVEAAEEAAASSTRNCQTMIDGEAVPFLLYVSSKFPTRGGYMFDLKVTCQDRETTHRVIIGKDYYEPQGITPERALEAVFAFLLRKKVPRQTEGMILSSQFPVNYFAVSEVEQFFSDFVEEYEELGPLPGDSSFWRFNRTQDYGYKGKNEDAEALAKQFALKELQ